MIIDRILKNRHDLENTTYTFDEMMELESACFVFGAITALVFSCIIFNVGGS